MIKEINNKTKKVRVTSLISIILVIFNIINIFLNKWLINNLIWYNTTTNIFLMTLIKSILYLIFSLFFYFGIKFNKKRILLFSSITFLLANITMLLFNDVSNYIFSFIIGILGIISSLFFVIVAINIYRESSNNSIHVVSCFFNTVIIVFTFVIIATIIQEDFEDIFYIGSSYSKFSFIYYFLQSMYFIFILNSLNIFLFNSYETTESNNNLIANGYSPIAKHILMPFCTLGFYTICWIYKITRASSSDSKAKAIENVILNIFVPFYSIYWYYKLSKNIENIFETKGVKNQSFSSLIIVLSIFLPFIAYIILQSKFNEAITINISETSTQIQQAKPVVLEEKQTNYINEIKSLKELLDVEAITQEEFDAKKKDLLGL